MGAGGLWQGGEADMGAVAVGRLKEDRTNEQVRQAITDGVAQIFVDFPFRANP